MYIALSYSNSVTPANVLEARSFHSDIPDDAVICVFKSGIYVCWGDIGWGDIRRGDWGDIRRGDISHSLTTLCKITDIEKLPPDRIISCYVLIRNNLELSSTPIYDENMRYKKGFVEKVLADETAEVVFNLVGDDTSKLPVSWEKAFLGKLQPVAEVPKAWIKTLSEASNCSMVAKTLLELIGETFYEWKEWVTSEEIIEAYKPYLGSCMSETRYVGAYGVGKGQKVVTLHNRRDGEMRARAVIDRWGGFVRCYPREFEEEFIAKGYTKNDYRDDHQLTLAIVDYPGFDELYPDSLGAFIYEYSEEIRIVSDPDGDEYYFLSEGSIPHGYTYVRSVAFAGAGAYCDSCMESGCNRDNMQSVRVGRGNYELWCEDCVNSSASYCEECGEYVVNDACYFISTAGYHLCDHHVVPAG